MTLLLVAFQFLTRVPSPVRGKIRPEDLGRSMRWFPAVGAVVGAVVAAVDLVLSLIWPPEVRSMAAVVLLVALTGALHLDGLMDACDALLAFTSPERRLEIMRDSRVGSFAIVGAATVLLMKYAAVLSLPEGMRGVAFVAMGALSRWSMVYATVRYPCARDDGLAHTFKTTAGPRELAVATAIAALACAPAGVGGVGALLLAWILTVAFARYAMSKVPGLTGDLYGALGEIVEVAVVVALPVLWRIAW